MSDSASDVATTKDLTRTAEPAVPVSADRGALPSEDGFDAGSALLRLLVGAMLVGTDELRDRMRRWDDTSLATETTRIANAADAAPHVDAAPQRTDSSSVRRALVGAAFETEARMRRGLSATLARVGRAADGANLVYTRLAFAVRGTPLDAVRRRLDELLFVALTAADRWTERGQDEEQRGRRMAEQAAVGVMDELLDYMAHNPQVRHLIEQQGMGMAGSAVDEARGRAASADQWIEQVAHNLLHRPARDSHVSQVKSAATRPPASGSPPASAATGAPPQARPDKARRPSSATAPSTESGT